MQQTSARAAEYNHHAIVVADFLRGIQTQLEEHATARGTELAVERAPAELRVLANEGALHQILLNLVDIATRCVMPGSSVRMWCESNTQQVAVRMRCGSCNGLRISDQAVVSATREVARAMGGDVKVAGGTYTVELQRTA